MPGDDLESPFLNEEIRSERADDAGTQAPAAEPEDLTVEYEELEQDAAEPENLAVEYEEVEYEDAEQETDDLETLAVLFEEADELEPLEAMAESEDEPPEEPTAGAEADELEEISDEEADDDPLPHLTKEEEAAGGDPYLAEAEALGPIVELDAAADRVTFTPQADDHFVVLVSGYNYRDRNDDYGDLARNRARVVAGKSTFKRDDALVFVWFSVAAGRVFVNRRRKGVWRLQNQADWTAVDQFSFDSSNSQSFSFEAIVASKHYGSGTTFLQNDANNVMSIVDVYQFLAGLGRHLRGRLREFSIISHGTWKGPILVNSFDNQASSAGRDPSDKDCRGRKDFTAANLSATSRQAIQDAFHPDGFSWMWGCFVAKAARAILQGVVDSGTRSIFGRRVRGLAGARYRADGTTPDTAQFRFALGKEETEQFASTWDAAFFPRGVASFDKTFAEIKAFATKHSDDTYCHAIAVATGRPCFGAPLGTSSNYAARDPYRPGTPVVHWIERGAARPEKPREREANYSGIITFFVETMKMAEDPERRGYVRYAP